MAYKKYITDEGKNKVLKLAFLNGANPFSYCALGDENSKAAETENSANFSELTGHNYRRIQIENDSTDITNCTLSASCIFDDDNFSTQDGTKVSEIGLCDAYEDDNPIYFAFSQVPAIEKTGSVSLKYTWIINIE